MTLDEIIAGIAHTKCQFQNEVYNHFGTNPQCPACQLESFRAELETIVHKWIAGEASYDDGWQDRDKAQAKCAAELRAKIREK